MAINTAGLVAAIREAVASAPSLTAWATERGFKHQNVSATLRGLLIPSETFAAALGYRRVTLQAYLKPGEAVPMLPPGWEEVTPSSATPKDWTPTTAQPLDEAGRRARASAAGRIGGPRKAANRRAKESGKKAVDSIAG